MADDPRLIIQLPKGSAVERQLREQPPQSVSSGDAMVDAAGHTSRAVILRIVRNG